jgi:hypothetical protein
MSLENAATQPDVSVHDRLMEKLMPEPPKEEQAEALLSEETPEVEAEEVPAESAELEAEQEADAIDDVPAEDEERQEYTLSDIAPVLGIESDLLDVNDDGELVLKTKIDGVEGTAKLSDLVTGYQLEGHLHNKTTEVAELQKALQAEKDGLSAQFQERMDLAENALQLATSELMHEYQSIDWEKAEEIDPGKCALDQHKYQQRYNAINQQLSELQGQRGQVDEAAMKERLTAENEKLLTAFPTWSNGEVRANEVKALTDYAVTAGYTPEQVSQITDSRAVIMLHKAMLYDQLQQKKPEVRKKVKQAPRLVKPKAPGNKKTEAAKKIETLQRRVKETGGEPGSVAALLLAKGKV